MTSRAKVYVLDPHHEDALEVLRRAESSVDTVLWTDERRRGWHEDADGLLVRSETKLKREDFQQAKKLRVVAKQGVGVDNIDLDAARQHGVVVCNTPGINSEAVAELALTLALCVARRVVEVDNLLRSSQRPVIRSQLLGKSLFQKTLGVVGMGNIGSAFAQKWRAAMNGSILAYGRGTPADRWKDTPHQRVHTLDELLRGADVVSLHVPLTDQTRNMIGFGELRLMKPDAILINTARGGIVDEQALLDALQQRRIWGAGLDALAVEPSTKAVYGGGLFQCPNVVILPHVGASTMENQSMTGVAAAHALIRTLSGISEGVSRLT